jgi:hypothetical protein
MKTFHLGRLLALFYVFSGRPRYTYPAHTASKQEAIVRGSLLSCITQQVGAWSIEHYACLAVMQVGAGSIKYAAYPPVMQQTLGCLPG